MSTWDLPAIERGFRSFLQRAAQEPVAPRIARGDVARELVERYSFDAPRPLEEIVADVDRLLLKGNLHTTHPRYFGLFNPGVRFASAMADLMVATANPQVGAWFHCPAAVEIEDHVLRFFARKFGLPEEAQAHFTSGGSEANLTAVLTAIAHAFPESRNGGVRAIDGQPVLFASAEAHHSFEKTAQHTGLGREALRIIETDDRDRMRVDALRDAIREARGRGNRPFFVAATAGTTGTGAIDPLPEIAAVCREEGLWLHVDAAWGGAACLSLRLRPYLAGIEQADSITCDAHKWISAPMGAGMFFTRHRAAAAAAFSIGTPYVPKGEEAHAPDSYAATLQWSRRFIGLKVFMVLAELGEEGVARQIDRHAEMAELLRRRLEEERFAVISSPLAVVCFEHPEAERLAREVVRRGRAWVSPLIRAGRPPAVRACVTNFETTPDDVNVLVEELVAARAASSRSPEPARA